MTTTTAAAPNPSFAARATRYIGRIASGAASLVSGLSVTFGYLVHPKRIVTEEYPENRATLRMHERFRGTVVMPHDAQGEHRCTACGICERACPNGSISVLTTRSLSGQKVLGRYIYRLSQCTLCGLCVESCPYDAIRMGNDFELATDDKSSIDRVLNLKEGRG